MQTDIQTLTQLPFLSLAETAMILRVAPQTIRKWVSINGRTQRPYNPAFPKPVRRSRLVFRTSDVLNYRECSDSAATFPSP